MVNLGRGDLYGNRIIWSKHMKISNRHYPQKTSIRTAVAVTPLLFSIQVFAQQGAEDKVFAVLPYAQATITDNAFLVSDEQSKTEETQTEVGIGAQVNYSNSFSDVLVNYSVAETTFSENSSEDTTVYDGSASLNLHTKTNTAGLLISHDSSRVLNDPAANATIQNSTQQDTTTLVPTIRFNIARGTTIDVNGSYSQSRFDETPANDVDQGGVGIVLSRQIGRNESYQITLEQRDSDFVESNQADFELTRISVGYNHQVGRLNYSVELGYDSVVSLFGDSDRSGSSLVNLSLDYTANEHSFTFVANNSIQDPTAQSNTALGNNANITDGVLNEPDQIERSSLNLGWNTTAICNRCNFGLGVNYQEDDYSINTFNSLERVTGLANFQYEFIGGLSTSVDYNYSETEFESLLGGEDFNTTTASLSLNYQFSEQFGINGSVENVERENDVTDGYTEQRATVRLSAQF